MEEKINVSLEKIRPYLQIHGGDIRLLEIKDDTAFLRFDGQCASCSLASITYNKLIRPLIQDAAPEIKKIIIDNE